MKRSLQRGAILDQIGKTTARQVAEAAGVSLSTVDRVLNGRGAVRPQKERAVIEAARRLRLDRALDQRPIRTLRVAMLIGPERDPFHAALRAALRRASDRLSQINVRAFVHELDPRSPMGVAESIRAGGRAYDALIVTCPSCPETAGAIREVSRTVPVVTLATDVPDSGRQAYVGPDDLKAGRVAGDLMGRLLGCAGGEVVMVAGLLNMTGQAERRTGFAGVLAERYPQCKLIDVLESRGEAARAGELIAQSMSRSPRLRGIYNASAGDRTIVEAVAVAGRTGCVAFVTHELTAERRALLMSGAIDAVIDQDPDTEMRTAIETTGRLLGRVVGECGCTVTPLHIHMRENA